MNYNIKHAECRAFGHAWEMVKSGRRPQFGRLLTLRCLRCTGRREDILSQFSGEVLSRSYRMPEGYSMSLEDGMTRAEWREHLANRYKKLVTLGVDPE